MIEVDGLTVRFGGVTSLDAMSLTFEQGTCGLIGPNGAGKTTFFNVLSGFVRPSRGGVRAFGDDVLAMPHYRRARWGLRRTFQTEQAIEELSVADNVALAHEHSRQGSRGARRGDVLGALEFVGLEVGPDVKVGTRGARDRRLVEVARAVVGHPRVVLLDEPAAGLPDEETEHLGRVIRGIPEHTGALAVLVDHDMSLVSACCEKTAVLDFGGVLRPAGGSVTFDGRHLVGRRPERIRRAGVAVVPEGRRLPSELTVEDNLRVATYSLTPEVARAGRADAHKLFPELDKRLTVPARSLSGGEQQMLVLAQALVSKPRFVLIDELSLGLAPVILQRLIPTIRAIAQSGVGVLLIEQFATVALGLAEHAYVMDRGRIRFSGLASELKAAPELLQTAYLP